MGLAEGTANTDWTIATDLERRVTSISTQHHEVVLSAGTLSRRSMDKSGGCAAEGDQEGQARLQFGHQHCGVVKCVGHDFSDCRVRDKSAARGFLC